MKINIGLKQKTSSCHGILNILLNCIPYFTKYFVKNARSQGQATWKTGRLDLERPSCQSRNL